MLPCRFVAPRNFRDVGEALGLWLDPAPIRAGRLFRGGRLDPLTTLDELGKPGTLLNLRRGPDPDHLDVRVAHVPACDDVENYETEQLRVLKWVDQALRVLAAPETSWPVYVHCTSGRDRTGVVVAAALVLVGVPRSIVVEEYLLSDGGLRPNIERAIDGVLGGRARLTVDVAALRVALGVG